MMGAYQFQGHLARGNGFAWQTPGQEEARHPEQEAWAISGVYTLVNFGYNPWSEFWKRNQTIFYLLAKEKFVSKSYFINTPVWLLDLLKHPSIELSEPKVNNWKAVFQRTSPRFSGKIVTPVIFPLENRSVTIRNFNAYLQRRTFSSIEPTRTIIVVNRPDTQTRRLVDRYFGDAVKIFDWSDDFEQFSADAAKRRIVRENVEYHIASADLVLCVNEQLWQRARCCNRQSFLVNNATNLFTFGEPGGQSHQTIGRGRPVIGYLGWINEARLDIDLIAYLAARRPDLDFVFVGPRSHADALSSLTEEYSNVLLRDPVPYDWIAGVLAQFDVCMLPNKLNEHTAGNDPIKLFDYLASGRPVVATKTAGTERLGAHLGIAHNGEEFLALIEAGLNSTTGAAERIACARQNSWPIRYRTIRQLVQEALQRHEN